MGSLQEFFQDYKRRTRDMKNSLKKGLHLYSSGRFFSLQSSLFRLVWPAILVLLTAQVQMSLQEEYPRALGMEDGRIPDSSIKASSAFNKRYLAANGRLNFKATNDRLGGWLAKSDDRIPWFRVSFGSAATVSRVATQGVYPYATWVKTFVLEYSKDGMTFFWYNNQQTFQGNWDQNSTQNNELKPAIDARVIRIHPKSWRRWKPLPGMRVEFYGCRPVSHGNVTGQAISAESIEVKWQFVGNKEDNSLPCGFKVWYRSVHTSTTNTNTWINQTVDTNTTDYIIHNLLAYTTYELYVEALNEACSGWLGHVARVTTHEKVAPSAPPRNITVVSVNYNNVVLQWLPPPQQSRNGKLLQYLVRSWPADEFINNSIARNYSHNHTSIEQQGTFKGLKSDTNYTVVLTVSNSVGTSPTSSPLYFRTLKVPSTTTSPKTEEMLTTIKVSPSTTVKRRKREEKSGASFVTTGVVLGVAVGLVLVIAVIAVYMFKKRRKNKGKKSPKKEQGVIAYNNDATFLHAPNLVDRVDNRITHQEQNELQTNHSYCNSEGNVKQNSFSKSNSHYASDIYSYANPEDLRCNQSKNEKFVEQNPMYDTAENLKSSSETADYDTVQGNPAYSPVSDKSFFEKRKNAPSCKNLVGKEAMGNLCSTQKAPEVSTAQPQMEPEYAVLEGPDPTATRHSDNVYEDLNDSDTDSGSHKHTQNQGPCDYDVIWNSPNQSQSDIKNIKESSVSLADKMASNSPSLYYEKVYLSKVDEDVVYDSTYETVRNSLA